MVRIYTRTGDKGMSSLYNGTRRPKYDEVFEALGHTDELNASLGLAQHYSLSDKNGLAEKLTEIQSRLLDAGSSIATPLDTSNEKQVTRTMFPEAEVDKLEAWIDECEAGLPPLKNFILPSGGLASCQLHIARTVARRAERHVMKLVEQEQCPAIVGRYLNRLSDFLFVAARVAAASANQPEIVYKKA